MLIYLIGLPGSGKSTVGRQLADVLNYSFHDLDRTVEARSGLSIPGIFTTKGEKVFRRLEQQVLRQSTELQKVVIATGGGAPCFFNNLEIMKKAGKVVFLNPPVEEIMRRLQVRQQQEQRPLMQGVQNEEDFLNKFSSRIPYYEQAHIIEAATHPDIQQLRTRLGL